MAGRGVNKVILIGNLGSDPEVRYMPNGGAVCNFNVATSESWKDKQTGEQRTQTEWHRITIYRRLAEIAGEYLKKGSKIYLEGRLQTRKWQGQDGQDRYTTEVIANEMQMLDSRSGGTANFDDNTSNSFEQPTQSAPNPVNPNPDNPNPAMPAPSTEPAQNNSGFDDFDDDVPF